MIPFRERNPTRIGAVGIAVVAALLLVGFKAGDLPLIGGGDTYYAHFSEGSGLKPNDEVRIAGVRVGKVNKIELDGDHVKVSFKISTSSRFGSKSGAEIKVKTLLGNMFLALTPAGSGQLKKGSTIPVDRTRSAYDVIDAFSGLAERTEAIDTDQLGTALDTLAEATRDTPAAFQGTLRGLSALSETVASRDEQIAELLRNLETVSGVLSRNGDDIVALMDNSDILLRALVARRDSVHRLLVSTSTLSKELTLLVKQSRGDLKPALSNLESVVDLLLKDQGQLDESLRLMAPFYKVFSNVLGNGPWFDTWITNLPPVPALGGAR